MPYGSGVCGCVGVYVCVGGCMGICVGVSGCVGCECVYGVG